MKMIGKTTNPLLQKTEEAIAAKVPANLKNAFQRIITAGLKVMYDPKTNDMMAKQLKEQGDPAEIAGAGVAKLLGMLMNQSKGTMPMNAAIPAATVLLCEGLDFMEQAKVVKVDNEVLSRAMQSMSSTFLQMLGVTPEKFQQMLAKAQAGQKPAQPAVNPALQAAQSAPQIGPTASPQGPVQKPSGTTVTRQFAKPRPGGIVGSIQGGAA